MGQEIKTKIKLKSQSIRGRFGTYITEDIIHSVAIQLSDQGFKEVVVAHDPRPSSSALYDAFIAGALSQGMHVYKVGCAPTPLLVRYLKANQKSCGVVITASHNEVHDNGIKIFAESGFSKIEAKQSTSVSRIMLGSVHDVASHARDQYVFDLKSRFPRLPRKKCLVDTARGVWDYCFDILEQFVDVVPVHQADAAKINQDAGILQPELLLDVAKQHELTVMVDGDGDRLMLISSQGELINGDDILYLLYQSYPQSFVGTVLSNTSLETFMTSAGHDLMRVSVGDQYVSARLKAEGLRFGGEPCGHIIDLNWLSSSDPMYILFCMLEMKDIRPLAHKIPQCCFNLPKGASVNDIEQICKRYQLRYVIRASQTEPVIRVMLEGAADIIQECQQVIEHHGAMVW